MPPFLQKIIDKSPFLTKVYEILDLYGSRRMGRSAAAFAYYLMLSFFPLLICVASIIGRTRIDIGELLELLSEVIPPQVTETLVTFFGYIHDNYSQAMLWAGIILLFTAASGAFGTIMATMGDLYGQQRYQGLLHTVMCFLYSAVFLVIIYLSVVVVATGDWFCWTSGSMWARSSPAGPGCVLFCSPVLSCCCCCCCTAALPPTTVPRCRSCRAPSLAGWPFWRSASFSPP